MCYMRNENVTTTAKREAARVVQVQEVRKEFPRAHALQVEALELVLAMITLKLIMVIRI